ncbi:type II toxin-antitoxin system ParD family antitoxin [Quatrionicoccus australiensis]|uniref:type II toxin-antitoxin system ParD family antitoxin n=1 Tax=Quatrionicoccus australiensis TaxID=138118 RepID=UPI001CF7ED16|nr:type II toxin-antitoxin system ParD family antitoxin [Quatrionicoccus australiensis]UCV16698.1 type II toxin-antitoxin system ParD family antitoxin [Quatrionicoccus australiensis]
MLVLQIETQTFDLQERSPHLSTSSPQLFLTPIILSAGQWQFLAVFASYGIVCQYKHLAQEAPMPTRNVVLTDHQARLVEQLVSSGRYQNASEVLREGLRLIERRESEDEIRLAALRDAAKIGIADIEAGNFRSFDAADGLGQHLAKLTAEAIGE